LSWGFTRMLSITGRHNGRQIFCDVVLMPIIRLDGIDADNTEFPSIFVLKALVDTGATNTCLTESAASKLKLEPLGYKSTMGVHGISQTRYYLFRIGFLNHTPNGNSVSLGEMAVLNTPIEGTELSANAGFDVLLGMDALSCGNLYVGSNGSYKFEFDNKQNDCY